MENIKKILNYSFSADDIKKYLGDSAKIIEYRELANYNNLFDLLPEDKSYAIILIETRQNSGHWTCIGRVGNGATNGKLLYFDSYGLDVDEELKFISPWWRKELQETEKLLTKLIEASPYELFYMSKHLQSRRKYDSTCGRWVCSFILKFLEGYSIEDYIKYVETGVETAGLEDAGVLKYSLFIINSISYMPS